MYLLAVTDPVYKMWMSVWPCSIISDHTMTPFDGKMSFRDVSSVKMITTFSPYHYDEKQSKPELVT